MGMDAAFGGWLAVATATLPVAQAGVALRDGVVAAEAFAGRWRAEHAVRVCGALGAARRNLEDAAAVLGDAGAVARAADAVEALAAAYPDALEGDGEGRCAVDGGRLAAALHREHNPRLPEDWPNWVYRLEAGGGRGRGR